MLNATSLNKDIFNLDSLKVNSPVRFYNRRLRETYNGIITKIDNDNIEVLYKPKKKLEFKILNRGIWEVIINRHAIMDFCKAKIVTYEDSYLLFGSKKLRKILKSNDILYKIDSIVLNHDSKKYEGVFNSVWISYRINGKPKRIKFVFEDLKIIYPNPKSINLKKPKHVQIGSEVKIKNDQSNHNYLVMKKLNHSFLNNDQSPKETYWELKNMQTSMLVKKQSKHLKLISNGTNIKKESETRKSDFTRIVEEGQRIITREEFIDNTGSW